MPTIRSICWNINNFKGSSWTKHGNTIMETIYDAAGTRLLDMFVVVEPYSKMKAFGLGDNVTDGAGLDGVLSLYFALAAKDLRWKVAPLRTTAMPPTSDMIALFFHSGALDCLGPDRLAGGVTGITVAPPLGYALPWDATSTRWPQVRFYDGGGVEVNFYGRRPSLYHLAAPDTAEQDFTLDVQAPVGGALAFVTDLLVDGAQGVLYEQTIQVEGGTPPYTFAEVPAGTNLGALAFDPLTQTVSGTPVANGAFSLEVEVTDSAVPAATTVSKTFAFAVAAPNATVGFDTPALPKVLQNQPFQLRIAARGGRGARHVEHAQVALVDALPAGVALGQDGLLSGTPTAAAPQPFKASVRAAAHAIRDFQLTVAAPGPGLAIHTTALPDGRVNAPYRIQLQGTGGGAVKTWTEKAPGTNLVAGLAFTAATGVLAGTPTANGPCTLDVDLSDGVTTVNAVLAFNVVAEPAELSFVTQSPLPPAALNEPYECQLVGGGGNGDVSFNAFEDLPDGLTMSPDGLISGTPTVVAVTTTEIDLYDVTRVFKIVALHAPPQSRHPKNRDSVRNLANIREIGALSGGLSVAVCGDFNVCTFPAQDCGTHKAGELTSLDPLRLAPPHGKGFAMGNANQRSSCKAASTAQKDVYDRLKGAPGNDVELDQIAKHAFDHLLTTGFAGGVVSRTMNLVRDDPGYAAAKAHAVALAPAPIKGIVRKYIWSSGVSDHLPIRFDLVL
ncbi:MAG: hypothetical protein R3B82_07845 [Sandaracinaceae bacterium]